MLPLIQWCVDVALRALFIVSEANKNILSAWLLQDKSAIIQWMEVHVHLLCTSLPCPVHSGQSNHI
jgi:hypothetical protein